ncbi:unnamed protein product [Penicillium olsonii]|nr:unnamed protein product [Penicillium olsonii]
MSEPNPEASSRAKTPRKTGSSARGKWSEERLLTSDKSALIGMDLVKLLSHPRAWNCLEESEKREILALLPPDVHPEAQILSNEPGTNIPPIPDSFVRYSNNWRDGVRQFQLDLENGRYDPKWLRQAQEARERRSEGAFDSFKEREYELFWGQKQKVHCKAPAGESARVKLGTLITEGVVQLGDVWRFYFVFGRGSGRIVIDKEARIDAINGVKLTFAIPPGERVLLRSKFHGDSKKSTPKKEEDIKVGVQTEPDAIIVSANHAPASVENAGSNETILPSNIEESPTRSSTDPHPVPTASLDEQEPENAPDFSVVIVSPAKGRNPKRTISLPETQSPMKRKRGRPLQNIHDPDNVPTSEIEKNLAIPNENQPESVSVVTPRPVLAEEIEHNTTVDAVFFQPYCASQDDSSPLSSPLSTPPASQEIEYEFTNAPINHATVDMSLDNDKTSIPEASVQVPTNSDNNLIMSTDEVIKFEKSTAIDLTNAPLKIEQDVPITAAAAEGQINEAPTSSQLTTDFATNEADEVIVPDVATPHSLIRKILEIDGRKPNGRTANAWKELRCYRNNQDMGSLFDVRETWFLQNEHD